MSAGTKRTATANFLYPPFLHRLSKGLKAVRDAGIPLYPFETYRSHYRQSWLYEQGRSRDGNIVTRARAGRSWHQYGIAADLVLIVDGKWSWEHEQLYVKAAPYLEKCGLHWLGRDPKRFELVHYQLPVDLSVYEAQSIYDKDGILGVWERFNERYGDKEIWEG